MTVSTYSSRDARIMENTRHAQRHLDELLQYLLGVEADGIDVEDLLASNSATNSRLNDIYYYARERDG